MKLYLNNEKNHVDPWLHNDILWGLKAPCDNGKEGMMKLPKYFIHIAFDYVPELINQYFLDSDLELFTLYIQFISICKEEYVCTAKEP